MNCGNCIKECPGWYSPIPSWMCAKKKENIMSEFKQYRRKALSEMRPYVEGEDMKGISISDADVKNGSPKLGDMIARNPQHHEDRWLVSKEYFDINYTEL